MPGLRDYISQAESIQSGDEFDIEIAPDELVEGRVIESSSGSLVLEISESGLAALEQRGMLSERIGRYGAVGSSRGMGFTLGEGDIDPNRHPQTRDYGRGEDDDDLPFDPDTDASDRDEFGNLIKHRARHLARQGMRQVMKDLKDEPMAEDFVSRMMELAGCGRPMQEEANTTDPLAAKAAALAPVGTMGDPTQDTTIDEAVMKDIAIDLGEIADNEDYDGLYDLLTAKSPAGEMVRDMYADAARDFRLHPDDDQDIILDRLMDRIVDDFGGQLDESPEPEIAEDLSEEMDLILQRAGVKEAFDQRKADAYNRAVRSGQSPEQAEKMAGITDADANDYEIDTDGQMKQLRVRAATAPGTPAPSAGTIPQIQEAEYQGRKVKLGKPFLTPGGPKKRAVYVKNPKGNIVKVTFGDPNMKIKKSNPERRKSFRARHRCENPGPRHKARYWSCRAW